MESTYQTQFVVRATEVDCYNRLKLSSLLNFLQEAAGEHCEALELDWRHLLPKGLFWAVIRYRIHINRLPGLGEKVTLETWAMPTTRTAYPRSAVARDENGCELFRAISLWVLMDLETRTMVLPAKSGVEVCGLIRGDELESPGSMALKPFATPLSRTVGFTDLDVNGHMNNCRYMDWIQDVLPSRFYRDHPARDVQICYLSEGREGDRVDMTWELTEELGLSVEARRSDGDDGHSRVFAARVAFG